MDLIYSQEGNISGFRVPEAGEMVSEKIINWIHQAVDECANFDDFDGDPGSVTLHSASEQVTANEGDYIMMTEDKQLVILTRKVQD